MEGRLVPGWTLLAPRKETYYRFDSTYRSDYLPIYLQPDQGPWNIWHCLARLPRTKYVSSAGSGCDDDEGRGDDSVNSACHMTSQTLATTTTIETLPSEVMGLVVNQPSILARTDIINFGLSSPALWRHVLSYLQMHCTGASGSLIGVEIALFCDVRHDLPESFKRNNYELIDKVLNRRHGKRQRGPLLTVEELNSCPFYTYRYTEAETAPEVWMRALKQSTELYFSPRMRSFLADELRWACKIAPFGLSMPDPRTWVLRNLSTMEYVCCCRDEYGGGQVLRDGKPTDLTIEDVLLWRIQCSDASTEYYGQEYSVSTPMAGSWSGHCFDILLLDEHEEEMYSPNKKEKEFVWKNVTDDVYLDMKDLEVGINKYKARVMEYPGPWYALKKDMDTFIRKMNS